MYSISRLCFIVVNTAVVVACALTFVPLFCRLCTKLERVNWELMSQRKSFTMSAFHFEGGANLILRM